MRPAERIAAEIRQQIRAGDLKPGHPVPSTRRIARDWGVAIATATRALAILQRDGLVQPVKGVGTRVASRPSGNVTASPRQLTRDEIIAHAIHVSDAEGLDAVSMRRVAADLGIPTMSLYRYVASKEELVLHMADTVMAEAPLPEPPPAQWRERLELVAHLHWTQYERHQWLPHVISMTRPQVMPHGVASTEWTIRALDGLGLEIDQMVTAAITLVALVRGIAVNLEPETTAKQETGLTSDEWMASQSDSMTRFMDAGPYPFLSRIIKGPDIKLDLTALFEYALARFLDGLASQIPKGSAVESPPGC